MRIVIATPIYPPEVGGPAYYAKNLAAALQESGHRVRVVTYGKLKRLPFGLRQIVYSLRVAYAAFSCDGIIAFDTYSVGLPALVAAKLSGARLVVRIGGDFVWEHYVNRTKDLVPLPQFYLMRRSLDFSERAGFRITQLVVRHARLVFSSQWLIPIWAHAYGIDEKRAAVVENAIPAKLESVPYAKKNFLFFTRAIPLKNKELFEAAFKKAQVADPRISLETGTISQADLMEKMRSAYAVVLPSISEVTPNYIIDAIRCGKPFLLTKYSGYAERFKDYGVIVDPLSMEDMAQGIMRLAEPKEYERLKTNLAEFAHVRPYTAIASEFVALLNEI